MGNVVQLMIYIDHMMRDPLLITIVLFRIAGYTYGIRATQPDVIYPKEAMSLPSYTSMVHMIKFNLKDASCMLHKMQKDTRNFYAYKFSVSVELSATSDMADNDS